MKYVKLLVISLAVLIYSPYSYALTNITGIVTWVNVGSGPNNILIVEITLPDGSLKYGASFDDGTVPFSSFSSLLSEARYSGQPVTLQVDSNGIMRFAALDQ